MPFFLFLQLLFPTPPSPPPPTLPFPPTHRLPQRLYLRPATCVLCYVLPVVLSVLLPVPKSYRWTQNSLPLYYCGRLPIIQERVNLSTNSAQHCITGPGEEPNAQCTARVTPGMYVIANTRLYHRPGKPRCYPCLLAPIPVINAPGCLYHLGAEASRDRHLIRGS